MPKDTMTTDSLNANKVFDVPLHLQPGQVNTLSFSQDAIGSMHLTPQNALEISFRDGSKINIENFEELANSANSCGRDTLIQLTDGTIIYPDQLRDQLIKAPVNYAQEGQNDFVVAEPKAGEMKKINIESGHEYKLGFALDGVSGVQSGHDLLLTFKNGGIVILSNYYTAVGSDLPPVMTLANGATIDSNALLASCKLVETPSSAEVAAADAAQSGLRQGQGAPDIEPASGDPSSRRSAVHAAAKDASQSVANIEPAAGDAGGPQNASGGFGFGSSVDPANFRNADQTGPIGATALRYAAPTIPTIPYLSGVAGATVIDYKPILGAAVSVVDETHFHTVTGIITADFGGDGPGVFSLNNAFVAGGSLTGAALTSHGDPVVVALVGNTYTGTANGQVVFTLTIDPVTSAYSYTQVKPFDHADTSNPDDVIQLSFGVTATDADGDTGTTTITVSVYDDGPVAHDDGVTVGSLPLTVSG
ncbi:MAG: DUF5801 repeats-in-toxin domain-containing protein, partial [Pseudomonadota bacterium]